MTHRSPSGKYSNERTLKEFYSIVKNLDPKYQDMNNYNPGIVQLKIRDDSRVYGWIFINADGTGHAYMQNPQRLETTDTKYFSWSSVEELKEVYRNFHSVITKAEKCHFYKQD